MRSHFSIRVRWIALAPRDICDALYVLFTLLQIGAVWLFPLFPTQDGPMQLYYADVLGDLIRGAGHYSGYFRIQGYLHPYSFFSYALLLLNQLFQPLTSERIVVSLYFLVFAVGARFLVRSINRGNRWLPLFLLPFALNTFLCIGVYNYSFGIATLMFAIGLWLRWSGAWTVTRALAWLALLFLLAEMHPLPLVILAAFIFFYLSARFAIQWRERTALLPDLLPAALLVLPLAWIASFLSASANQRVSLDLSSAWLSRLLALVRMVPLSPYLSSGYPFYLLLLVIAPLTLTFVRQRAAGMPKPYRVPSLALAFTCAVCLGVYLFFPAVFLGMGYFCYRMAFPLIICFLSALAPVALSASHRRIAAVFATCVFFCMLNVRWQQTSNIVDNLAPLYRADPLQHGAAGAIVSGSEPIFGLTFNPYYWAGAEYARRGRSVLLNSPWLNSPVDLLARNTLHAWDNTAPSQMGALLSGNSTLALPQLAFVCGGKWDGELPPEALARSLGMVRRVDSHMIECYDKPESHLARAIQP